MIYCYDIQGQVVPAAAETVIFRPAVYGILIDKYAQVLLLRHPHADLWYPPGDVVEPPNTPSQAVRFCFHRVTGIMPEVGPLLFVENQYRVLEDGRACQLVMLYYALERSAVTTATFGAWDEGSTEVKWTPIADLDYCQMLFGYEAVRAGQLRLRL